MAKTKGTKNLKRKSQENVDAKPSKHSKVEATADESSTSNGNNDDMANYEPKSNLLSLNADVVFEIFDFLNLNDLCAISQQCQRLYELAEFHFNRRYPQEAAVLKMLVDQDGMLKYPDCSKQSLIFFNLPRISLEYTPSNNKKSTVNSFDDIFELNSIFKNKPKENRIKELRFVKWLKLMPAHGQGLKDVVGKVKSIIFSNTTIFDEFYETILKYASSMELLTVWQSFEIYCEQDEQHNWLLQRYPNLKRFAWHAKHELFVSKEVKTFFDTIEHFSLLSSNIQTIQHCVQNKIEINDLFFKLKSHVALILGE